MGSLADTTAFGKHRVQRGRDVAECRIELELVENAMAQVLHRGNHSPSSGEETVGEGPQRGVRGCLRGVRKERCNVGSEVAAGVRRSSSDSVPGRVALRQLTCLQADFQLRCHRQRSVRVVHGEVNNSIAERIERLLPLVGRRCPRSRHELACTGVSRGKSRTTVKPSAIAVP